MAKIIIATDEGEVVEVIELKGWDLSKSLARMELGGRVLTAVEVAERIESMWQDAPL